MKSMKIKEILYSKKDVDVIVSAVADKINKDYEGCKELILLCVLKGAAVFAVDLMRKLNIPNIRLEFIRASSYGTSDTTSGNVRIKGLTADVADMDILVVEDIVDTGLTLSHVKAELLSRGPHSLRFCALFDKPSRRVNDFKADYIGTEIPDDFIVGYGLDFAEEYRALPYVALLG